MNTRNIVSDWYNDIEKDFDIDDALLMNTCLKQFNMFFDGDNAQINAASVLFVESCIYMHRPFTIDLLLHLSLNSFSVEEFIVCINRYITFRFNVQVGYSPHIISQTKSCGDDAFTKVSLGIDKTHGIVFLKEFTNCESSQRSRYHGIKVVSRYAIQELSVSERVRGHSHLVSPYYVYWSAESKICMVYPYLPLSFYDVFNINSLPEHFIKQRVCELLTALSTLHDKLGIVHRDIKCDNLRFSANGTLYIVDYDNAIIMSHDGEIKARASQTVPMYTITNRPPEILLYEVNDQLNGQTYDAKKADIWATASVITAMYNSGKYIFSGNTPHECIKAIVNFFGVDAFPDFVQFVDRTDAHDYTAAAMCIDDVLMSMFAADPNDRPSAQQVLHTLKSRTDEQLCSFVPVQTPT